MLLAVVGASAALVRLLGSCLARRYPITTIAVAFALARMIGLGILQPKFRLLGFEAYGLLYVATQPVVWALYFLVILELYSLALEDFPGVRRLGRLALASALGAVTLTCLVLLMVDQQAGIDPSPFLSYLALEERSVFLTLCGVTLLLLLFAAYFRLPVRRNVLILWACFGSYFLVNAALLALRWHLGADFRPLRNVLNPVCYGLALLSAALFVSPAGEIVTRRVRPVWGTRDPDLETALSLQLRGFNEALVKVLRT